MQQGSRSDISVLRGKLECVGYGSGGGERDLLGVDGGVGRSGRKCARRGHTHGPCPYTDTNVVVEMYLIIDMISNIDGVKRTYFGRPCLGSLRVCTALSEDLYSIGNCLC